MRFIKGLICASVLLATQPSYASVATSGYITNINVLDNGVVEFNHSGGKYGDTACAASNPHRWAFNGNTTAGQAKLATILTAYSLHRAISIFGQNQCPDWGDIESVSNFTVIETP